MDPYVSECEEAGGYRALVRCNPDFRYLWLGQVVSLLGDWFNLIATASLVGLLTESGFAVGSLFVVRMLAPFLVSPIAGVAADHFNRKHLLIAADIVRAVTVLGFLLVRRPEQVWLLYTLTAVQLGLSGFFFPARNAILPDVTRPGQLAAANALSAATWSVMLATGAALGGFAAGIWGIYPAFLIDGATFILSALLIARIRYRPAPRVGRANMRAGLVQYVDGLRYLRRAPDILVLVMQKGALGLAVAGAFQVIQVPLAERVFVIGEAGSISLGLMYAAVGVGTGVGPFIGRMLTRDRRPAIRLAMLGSYAITALGLALLAPLTSFPLVLAGSLLRGLGSGTIWVFSTQLLLEMVPEGVRGRVFSSDFALNTLFTAAGAAAAGAVLDIPSIGIGGVAWAMAGATVVFGAGWGAWLAAHREQAAPAG